MEVIRIATAGSVDDGKSTLIGRLLYDTRSITNDKFQAIETLSRRKGLDFTDLSLFADGLVAEREQGITIDVAYIYFSTPQRKFIIADTPGHIEYTRNMITGASTASVFLILIDARNGITEQTRRHFYIASLMQIKHVAVCINKMDLVGYDEQVFQSVRNEFNHLVSKTKMNDRNLFFIPIVAKDGDHVTRHAANMQWYQGATLLEYLENINVNDGLPSQPERMAVQYVIRPHQNEFHDFRGYAGRVVSGTFSIGDEVMALPSMRSSSIASIRLGEENTDRARSKESVLLTLKDDIDIGRGTMLVKRADEIKQVTDLRATICWMNEDILTEGKTYLLQHGVNSTKAKIKLVYAILNINTLAPDETKKYFSLNDIGSVQIKLASPVFADLYAQNPSNGSFILIDEFSNNTVAVGFIDDIL